MRIFHLCGKFFKTTYQGWIYRATIKQTYCIKRLFKLIQKYHDKIRLTQWGFYHKIDGTSSLLTLTGTKHFCTASKRSLSTRSVFTKKLCHWALFDINSSKRSLTSQTFSRALAIFDRLHAMLKRSPFLVFLA